MKFSSLLRTTAVIAFIGAIYSFSGLNPHGMAAQAQDQKETTSKATETKDPVVARVYGEEIHQSDIRTLMGQMDSQAQKIPPEALYPLVIDRIINTKLITHAAQE